MNDDIKLYRDVLNVSCLIALVIYAGFFIMNLGLTGWPFIITSIIYLMGTVLIIGYTLLFVCSMVSAYLVAYLSEESLLVLLDYEEEDEDEIIR